MTPWYLPLAGAYVALTVALGWFERHRSRENGVDPITVFLVVAGLQTCLAGAGIFAILPFVSSDPTGTEAFDHIYFLADPSTGWMVFCLTAWFFVWFYVGCALGRAVPDSLLGAPDRTPDLDFRVHLSRLAAAVVIGAGSSLGLFLLLGDTMVDRYASMILLRSQAGGVARTAFSSNAFVLTQTWSWLSVVLVLAVRAVRGRGLVWGLCIGIAVFLAFLGVSRRALFLPLLLAYLTMVMWDGRWRARWIAAGVVPLGALLAYGKSVFAAIAFNATLQDVAGTHASWANAALRASSDLGITIVESLGSIAMLDLWPRLGVDHLLSIARRFPDGMLGMVIDFPERMVRVSTATFAGNNALDIPPGLLGQMWLDAGPFGPVFWGLFLGVQVGVLQGCYRRTRRTLQACAVFTLLVFVVALPVNTGSLDFTFSVDIAVLLLVIWACTSYRRVRGVGDPRGAAGYKP